MNQNWALNLSFRPWPEKNDIFELQIYNLMDSSISFSHLQKISVYAVWTGQSTIGRPKQQKQTFFEVEKYVAQ